MSLHHLQQLAYDDFETEVVTVRQLSQIDYTGLLVRIDLMIQNTTDKELIGQLDEMAETLKRAKKINVTQEVRVC